MWKPEPFEHYRERWPATPALPAVDVGPTEQLIARWNEPDAVLDAAVREAADGLRIVFVRGYLGNLMPGNLVAPTRALRDLGLRAAIAPTSTTATAEDNVRRLVAHLEGDDRVLLCGHSKGGLECLLACVESPELQERTVGVVLSQSPRGPSAVMESLLLRAHEDSLGTRRWIEEWTQRIGLYAVRAHRGGHQLTADPLHGLIRRIDAAERPFPVWQTASWSSQPTTWLDSFHERLGEIRPDCAHDGQFFLEDLVWPEIPHVLLAHVDHAQPAMGGFGFDHVRYWKLLISAFLSTP